MIWNAPIPAWKQRSCNVTGCDRPLHDATHCQAHRARARSAGGLRPDIPVHEIPSARKRRLCKNCGESSPSEFYAKNASECKACTKARTKKNYRATIHEKHEYERRRRSTEERKAQMRATVAARDPVKRAARYEVQRAIRRGVLVKRPCEECGSTNRLHAHHDDYSKPLEVRWLCIVCHGVVHGKTVTIA